MGEKCPKSAITDNLHRFVFAVLLSVPEETQTDVRLHSDCDAFCRREKRNVAGGRGGGRFASSTSMFRVYDREAAAVNASGTLADAQRKL